LTNRAITKPPTFLITFRRKKSSLPSQQTLANSRKRLNCTKKEQKSHAIILKKSVASPRKAVQGIQTKALGIGHYRRISDTIGFYRSAITTF
jgi:hypothetical protein